MRQGKDPRRRATPPAPGTRPEFWGLSTVRLILAPHHGTGLAVCVLLWIPAGCEGCRRGYLSVVSVLVLRPFATGSPIRCHNSLPVAHRSDTENADRGCENE